ncbi:MAG: sulfotransferase [Melioribacteraceae bacterium]|nr:sulfotransferase [Saprospiraceae bacterium]MCF8355742.1 sulfotransferase [Melioribacteraceae bacterium]MCF8394770.1 sulfotransferase [Melioribacteraceae bacterium]
MNKNVLLLSGTMRSGTTLMSHVLNAQPNIAFLSDKLNWFWNRIFPFYILDNIYSLEQAFFEQKYFIKLILDYLNMDYVDFQINLIKNLSKYKYINEEILYNELHFSLSNRTSEIIGDKSTHSINVYERFIEKFPNGKIIHMVRDPYDVYYSQLMKVRKTNKITTQLKMINNVKDRIIISLLPSTIKKKYIVGNDIVRNYFIRHPKRIIDYWNSGNMSALQLSKKYPNRIKIIKYEDLILNTHQTISDISELLNIDMNYKNIEYTKIQNGKGNNFHGNSSLNIKFTSYDKSRIGNGIQKLSNQDIVYINNKLSNSFINKFGYQKNE